MYLSFRPLIYDIFFTVYPVIKGQDREQQHTVLFIDIFSKVHICRRKCDFSNFLKLQGCSPSYVMSLCFTKDTVSSVFCTWCQKCTGCFILEIKVSCLIHLFQSPAPFLVKHKLKKNKNINFFVGFLLFLFGCYSFIVLTHQYNNNSKIFLPNKLLPAILYK